MQQFQSEVQQQECKKPNVYFVFAGKFGTVRDGNSELKSVDWTRTVTLFILRCSCIPLDWLKKDNYIVEGACWFDGTAFYAHHGTKVDVLMCQFLEVSVHYLSQLHVYHALAAFPYKAVWVDVYRVIQLCYTNVCFLCSVT